jgi:hypothetical protein
MRWATSRISATSCGEVMAPRWQVGTTDRDCASARAWDRPSSSVPAGSVPEVMGMGGAGGPEAERRRRLIAGVLVLAMVLGSAAVVLSTVLG